jgi:hypothetical protein
VDLFWNDSFRYASGVRVTVVSIDKCITQV